MASYVFMKVLESSPERYDAGISLLSLGRMAGMRRDIVDNYIAAGDEVLDIGCGTGILAVLCAEKGASVVAFDASRRMLAIAERRVSQRNLTDKVQLREMSAVAMDKGFADESFDKIVSTLVFSELYPDEQRFVLREARRILRPGGLLIIADEVRPSSAWKRFLHMLVRLPLAAAAYALTQTSTRALKGIEDALGEYACRVMRSIER